MCPHLYLCAEFYLLFPLIWRDEEVRKDQQWGDKRQRPEPKVKNKTLKPRNRIYYKRPRILSWGNTHRLQEPDREFSSWKPLFVCLHHLFSFILFLARCFLLKSISPWSTWDKIKILVLTLIDFFRRKQRWRDLWCSSKREASEENHFSSKTMIMKKNRNKYVRSTLCEIL